MNTCPVCGKPALNKYCSQLCHATTRRKRLTRTCPECGKEFETIPTESAIYCSIPCRRSFEAKRSPWYAKQGKRAVHRIEAEKKIGRPLLSSEVVQHIDGNPRNNDWTNLRVFSSQAEHIKHEIATGQRDSLPHEHYVLLGRLSVESRRAKAKHLG